MAVDVEVQERFVTLDGLRFHYRAWGRVSAPPLVLLHGLAMQARAWDSVAAALADRLHVLALDLRGHGATAWADDYALDRMVEDVEALAVAAGLAHFALVGHSLGAAVALQYAARHPEHVERLVAVEGRPAPEIRREGLRAAQAVSVAAPAEVVEQARERWPRQSVKDLRNRILSNLRPRADGRWVWRYDAEGLADSLAMPPESTSWAALRQIACPTLIVRGAESAFPGDEGERMMTAIPDARLAVVADSGHMVYLDNLAGFLEVVRPFLLGDAR